MTWLKPALAGVLTSLAIVVSTMPSQAWPAGEDPVNVFSLAGQSNLEDRALASAVSSDRPPGASALRPATSLKLTAPLDYQVAQRSTAGQGALKIAGEALPAGSNVSAVEVRIDSTNAGAWRKVAARCEGGRFSGETEVPAGGWYRVAVRVLSDKAVLAESTVEHVGVGEVFVVAGQSNSANHGEEKQTTKTGRVAAFDGRAWRLANDPQPGASGRGGSFLPPFGDAIAERFDVPVGFVACGIGATSVREWLPKGSTFPNPPTIESRVVKLPSSEWESNGEAFTMFTRRMKQLGPRGFRAVLWHQGESDASQADPTRTLPGRLYREYLEKVIRESRRAIGWDAPWFVAQVSYHKPGDEASPDIRAAQASLWQDGVALEGPDTDALKGELRQSGGKGVHFSGPGLRAHAARWVEKVAPWLERELQRAAFAHPASERETRNIAGWTVHISPELLTKETQLTERALELLQKQLEEIVRAVPVSAVAELQKVPLYFSPEYPGQQPRAEFHPDAGWLRDHGRDPAMAKGVEFTNVRIFERELNRMPNFALHELAHAYHDRVLPQGFGNAEIKAAYERAKASGKYDRVERWNGNGEPNTFERAYAMTNPQEYFAETTEAFFSRNDFFPFTRAELKQHDPEMFALLEKLWSRPPVPSVGATRSAK